MEDMETSVTDLYTKDEYFTRYPSIHEEDSPWKITKILPLVDRVIRDIGMSELSILDVGGGAGLILRDISNYVEQSFGIAVNKFALDLSPGMLGIQKKRNPDLKRTLNEDIRKTSIRNKEIDLTLMIDLLEHVPNPTEALEEVKRISRYVILKVPLEDDITHKVWNLLDRERPRRRKMETLGHINFCNYDVLKGQVEKHTGQLVEFHFVNVFEYYRNSQHYQKRKRSDLMQLRDYVAAKVFRLSPRLCSFFFPDHVVILVKCY
jgi:ubiquinone/menaquinone biosynthesis C-methylase UbiE